MDIRGLATCADLVGKILFHEVLNRGQISQLTELSPASVTNYTRWLLEIGVLGATSTRQPHAIRPIEELRLRGERGAAVAVAISKDAARAELVALNGAPLSDFSAPVAAPDQRSILAAIASVVQRSRNTADRLDRAIDLVTFSTAGIVAMDGGAILAVHDLPGWQPCEINQILPAVSELQVPCRSWIDVACKARALAAKLRQQSHVGYLEFGGGTARVASIREGHLDWGKTGLSLAWLHRQVQSEKGPQCYCGRRGCLVAYLERGEFNEPALRQAMTALRKKFDITDIAFEWPGDRQQMLRVLREAGFRGIHEVSDPTEYIRLGLRLFTAEAAAKRIIDLEAQKTRGKEGKWASRSRTRLSRHGATPA